jgi:hypothetical protein
LCQMMPVLIWRFFCISLLSKLISYKLLHSCTHFSSKNKPTGPKDLCPIANNPGHK